MPVVNHQVKYLYTVCQGAKSLATASKRTPYGRQRIQEPSDSKQHIDISGGTKAHNCLGVYESSDFSALTFPLEPLVVGVNYARKVLHPQSIAIIGLSVVGTTTG
ncbi:hypothetical protein [Streptomyces sp. NPDC092129]|uniref:hypothetical protein n=1 Tax=Streptomyces sp. NPDC092129 TaxID=3366010 RepID=UPI00381CABD9